MAEQKRKHVTLSIEQKLTILKKVAGGASLTTIAKEYDIGKSTVSDIKKNEEKLKKFAAGMESFSVDSKSRKIMRLANDDELDQALYLWFVQKRSQNIPVSGPLLTEKALQLHALLHESNMESVTEFKASKGWLWRFCNRHAIRQLSLQGEKLSSSENEVAPFKKDLQQVMEENQITLEQLYNCDETGLYYRSLPAKTLAVQSEKQASGMKKQKDRVTLMGCSNATGTHKFALMFVGKAANPRCFKHVNKKALPVVYYNQRNAWADCEIFTDWFYHQFIPGVKKHLEDQGLPHKALLLLDNAPAHPEAGSLMSDDGCIKAMFLPPNTTALIQPMDQGVLEALKRRYRRRLLHKLLLEDKDGQSMIEYAKSINLKDVVYMVASAWDDIPASTFKKSWNKLLKFGGQDKDQRATDTAAASETASGEVDTNAENDLAACQQMLHSLVNNISNQEISEWLDQDSDDPGYQYLTDTEIIDQVTTAPEEANDDDDDDSSYSQEVATCEEVTRLLDKCLSWYECQDECTAPSLMVLKNVRDLAAQKRFTNAKQLTLDSYFHSTSL